MKKLLALFVLTIAAYATNLTAIWDRNPEPDIAHYRLYQSTGTNAFVRVGDASTNNQITITNVTAGTNRFFVTAENSAGLESPPSAIVTLVLNTPNAPTGLMLINITNVIQVVVP
jgi:fibronectin type 3 domain-containing protein